jgi:peptidoglycan/xylan/chitin deacetylase (PgdA/CDA1 family)
VKQFLQNGRRTVRAAYIRVLFLTGLLKWAKWRVAKSGTVVLTLHRVLADAEYDASDSQRGMLVRAPTFQLFLEYLHEHCHLVSLDHVVAAKQHRDGRPRVALTFDDGWKDTLATAFPLIGKYALPFTVFICPECVGGTCHFWTESVSDMWGAAQRAGKLHVVEEFAPGGACSSLDALTEFLKQSGEDRRKTFLAGLRAALVRHNAASGTSHAEQVLNWNDVAKMSQAGVQFGSHTSTHQMLTQLSPSEALRELTESKRAIEAQLRNCPWLAYPNGDWSESVRQLVSKSGYQRAFANAPGIWKHDTNLLSIPRVNIWEGKLTGSNGRFSRMNVEYTVFWAAYRASRN